MNDWYQVIRGANTVKSPLVTNDDDLCGYEEDDFTNGEYIGVENWCSEAWVGSKLKKDDGDPDDVLVNHLMIPIFSPRLKKNIEKITMKEIEFLPLKIIKPSGSIINSFYIANIVNVIEAVDKKKSEFDIFPNDFPNPNMRGKISFFKKLILNKKAIKNNNIFRLAEYKEKIIVSGKVKEVFVKNNYTGYKFSEVESV